VLRLTPCKRLVAGLPVCFPFDGHTPSLYAGAFCSCAGMVGTCALARPALREQQQRPPDGHAPPSACAGGRALRAGRVRPETTWRAARRPPARTPRPRVSSASWRPRRPRAARRRCPCACCPRCMRERGSPPRLRMAMGPTTWPAARTAPRLPRRPGTRGASRAAVMPAWSGRRRAGAAPLASSSRARAGARAPPWAPARGRALQRLRLAAAAAAGPPARARRTGRWRRACRWVAAAAPPRWSTTRAWALTSAPCLTTLPRTPGAPHLLLRVSLACF